MKIFWGLILLSFVLCTRNVMSTSESNVTASSSTPMDAMMPDCGEVCSNMLNDTDGSDNDTLYYDYDYDNGNDTGDSSDSSSIPLCVCSTMNVTVTPGSIISDTTMSVTLITTSISNTTMSVTLVTTAITNTTETMVAMPTTTAISTSVAITTAVTTSSISTQTTSISVPVASTNTTSSSSITVTTVATISATVTSSVMPPVGDGGSEESSSGNVAGIAAGLSLGLGLPIIILTIIAIIICYKLYVVSPGRRTLKRKSDSKQRLDDEYNMNGSVVVGSNEKTSTVREKTKETTFNRPSFPPIELENLPTDVSDLHENNDAGFSSEYKFIQQSSPALSQTHAYIDANMEKNRYRNILPFDDTRVILKAGGESVTDNYINANYIDGYSSKNAYIASQGPLPNTVSDFWQMIWEQKCEIIVMLTGLVESGKRKCTQYWPEPQDGALQYGNIEVKLIAQNHYSFYTYTSLEISQKQSTGNTTMISDKRRIQHFAFTQWPDFGVPINPQSMLRFTRLVRSRISPHKNNPVLVHCSAGVGRTGTFIAIDVMLQKMAKQQALNVKEFVLGMRYQRNNMVQTERQYVFLYDALLEAYLYGDTAVRAKNFKHYVWSLTQENQETGLIGMEEEYYRLPSCDYSEETYTVALSADNIRKNRDKSYIPFDFNRITVGDEKKYINAVGVKGYTEEIEFIATQHPLVNTIGDFWTMVCEQNVKVIVMLGGLKNIKDSYLKTTRHPVVVTKETDNEFYTVTHVTINKPQEHSVVHYTFKAWVPENEVPTAKSILSLLKEVHSVNDPGHPVVVHSSTSMSKEASGVYCTLAVCLDTLNNEGFVDVFQTVRTLREQRPYILYSKDFYKFIYLCIVEFLQAHRKR